MILSVSVQALTTEQIRQIEEIAQAVASQHNANSKYLVDDMTVSSRAIAVKRNVRFENVLRVKKGLPSDKLKEFADETKREILPKACKVNANNPAFSRGLYYTFVYYNTYGEKLAEFDVDEATCRSYGNAGSPRSETASLSTSWLDKPLVNWNKPGGIIPAAPEPEYDDPTKSELCKQHFKVRPPTNPVERALMKAGWVHYKAEIGASGVSIFFALTSVDSMGCRPYGYQYFVFVDNVFAGTLSPVPMNARNDGSVNDIIYRKGTGDIVVMFDRYTKEDGLCCPSRTSTVTYKVERGRKQSLLIPTSINTGIYKE